MEHRIESPSGPLLRRLATLVSIALAAFLIACGAALAAPSSSLFHPPSSTRSGQTTAAAEQEEEVEWEWTEEEEEEVEGEGAEWESEEGEEEIEVEIEFEETPPAHKKASDPGRPAECGLQGASARVVASNVSNTLRLSLRYASRDPVHIEVDYGVGSARSVSHLDPMNLRPARHGRVDYTEHLGSRRMSELRTAHTLVVTIEVPGNPRVCQRYATKRLTVRQHRHAQTIWTEALQSRDHR